MEDRQENITVQQLNAKTVEKLRDTLKIAATVPGNYQRFQEANLIQDSSSNQPVKLTSDWLNAFFKLRSLTKETLSCQPGLFLAQINDLVYRGNSSGSTGKPYTYFAGKEWNNTRLRISRQSLAWWGIDNDTPIINVSSRLQPIRKGDITIAGYSAKESAELLLTLLAQRPSVIRGYPSRLCEVAVNLYQRSMPSVISVICTGECLFEYQKTLLENVFNAPVINEYGCPETGISGLSCPEIGRLHLDTERCLYEVIEGQLVTTDLLNHIMPMVRYQCGDVVELNMDTCPCGRPGLTGKVLGRTGERIRTRKGIKHSGEIYLPTLEGILNYSVERQENTVTNIRINIAAGISKDKKATQSLSQWIQTTFGDISPKIQLENSRTNTLEFYHGCTDSEWIKQVTSKSWTDWPKKALSPQGMLQKSAQLLRELIHPKAIAHSGLIPSTLELLFDVLESPPCRNLQSECMVCRVLLFSCSFFLDDQAVVTSIYSRASQRLHSVINRKEKIDDNILLDLLIPTLFLETDMSLSIWTERIWLRQCELDQFNIHHLLHAFEGAEYRAHLRGETLATQKLAPIQAILTGDLNFWASQFSLKLLAHWFGLVHGQSISLPKDYEVFKEDSFRYAWQKWRQKITEEKLDLNADWLDLRDAARSPEEIMQTQIERGYSFLLQDKILHPDEWLLIIQDYVKYTSNQFPNQPINLMPWIPIMRGIVKPLLIIEKHNSAYQFLLASTLPLFRISALDRLDPQFNSKQSVIFDSFV